MLTFVLRRILWALPTLVGISLVVFLLTSLLPEPDAAIAPGDLAARDAQEEARRVRFLDLPRFVNENPVDVTARAEALVDATAAGGDEGAFAGRRLAAIGGAALPTALPRLATLNDEGRLRVARALQPLATRMGIDPATYGATAADQLIFWERFWQDHVMDFTPGASGRAVDRLVRHGTELRADELARLDTYALADVVAALKTVDRFDARLQLLRIFARLTALPGPPDDATPAELEGLKSRYLFFWYVHRTDYVPLTGLDRLSASLLETRYAKWSIGAFTGSLEQLPTRADRDDRARLGEGPMQGRLAHRTAVTATLLLLSLLGSHAVAIPLGVLAAARRGRRLDRAISLVLFMIYSLPTFVVAALFRGAAAGHVFAPVLALSFGAAATLSRYQRTALLEVLTTDYIRTARAKGASGLRVLLAHALRNAVLPIIALAGVQVPQLLGGAFVVEEVWQIRGLGWETLRAIERRDIGWLVAVVCLTAVLATLALVAADVAQALLDPRVRETFRRQEEGA